MPSKLVLVCSALAVTATLIWFGGFLARVAAAEGYFASHEDRESRTRLAPVAELPAETPLVYAGIFVEKVYELALASRTFSAD